jgi:hypothetical protein
VTKVTTVVALMATFLAAGAGSVRAQGQSAPETKVFLSVDVGAQPQQRTIETSSSFALYDETATIKSSQPIHNGPMFGVTGGYRLMPHIGVAVGLTMFNARASDSTVVASIPDLVFFSRPKTVTQTATGLKHSETGVHIQGVWFYPVGAKLEIVIAGGPSVIRVKLDLITNPTVPTGTQNLVVTSSTQSHRGVGFNAGFEGNYFLSARLGVGLFVRYVGGTVDLPAVTGLKVGGAQAGLGARVRF